MKKGQFSVFIILSLVIVVILVLLITFKYDSQTAEIDNELHVDSDFSSVRDYAQECLDNEGINSIYTIGSRGGYYNYTSTGVAYLADTIPYYLEMGLVTMPSINQVEDEISLMLKQYLISCYDDFNTFSDLGYNLTYNYSNLEIDTTIGETNVAFDVKFPITVKFSGKVSNYQDFKSNVYFDFNDKYQAVKNYVDLQKTNLSVFFLSDLIDLSKIYGFDVTHITPYPNTMLYMFEFNDTYISDRNFTYIFAVKFNWSP
jgi:hypothetical protein